MTSHISWSEGERAAREAESRRGRLVGKDGADSGETFASGSATCTRCGVEGDAGTMMRESDGMVCEGCYFQAESGSRALTSWRLRAAGTVGLTVLGYALLAILVYAVWRGALAHVPEGNAMTLSTYDTGGGASPLQFPLLSGGLFAVAFFLAWPLFRLFRSEASLHGLSTGQHRLLGGSGAASLALSALGLVLSVGAAVWLLVLTGGT